MRKIKKYRFALYLMVLQLLPIPGRTQGIEITSGGTISVTSAATFELNNQGFVNNGAYAKGAETVTFSGTVSKTISGSSYTDMHNLSITNTGGLTTQLGLLETNHLTIGSGSKFTIDPGKAVVANGTLVNSAGINGLIIRSDSYAADGTGSLVHATTGVGATVERYMSGDLWHLISPAATASETIDNFVCSTGQNDNLIARNTVNYGLAPYLASTDEWDYFKVATSNTGSFDTPGKGYQVLRATGSGTGKGNTGDNGKVSFKGILAGGGLNIALEKTGNRWNLLGNPYPCALDAETFLSVNSALIDPSYLFFYVSTITDVTTYGYEPNEPGLKLSPGEGFFIKAKTGGTSPASFTTAMKSTASDAFKSAKTDYPGIRLFAETSTDKKSTSIKYIPGMSIGLDPGWDAGLFNGGPLPFSIFTRLVKDNGVDFAIQCLPDENYENLIVPVGLVAAEGSTVTFKATSINLPTNYKIYLEDRSAGTFNRLDEAGSLYSVVLNANSKGTGRFYLHTTQIAPTVPTELTFHLKVIPLPKQKIIRIMGEVVLPARALIYDMTGRIITAIPLLTSDQNEIPLIASKSGIYLLIIESDMTPYSEKILWIPY